MLPKAVIWECVRPDPQRKGKALNSRQTEFRDGLRATGTDKLVSCVSSILSSQGAGLHHMVT